MTSRLGTGNPPTFFTVYKVLRDRGRIVVQELVGSSPYLSSSGFLTNWTKDKMVSKNHIKLIFKRLCHEIDLYG